ncbi:MAG: rhomboid family intramembrane serine protease [Desulfovermiculus sp.]|nr:rhomboid family intramembrane serine protease [Desulfovermiculus sp.]
MRAEIHTAEFEDGRYWVWPEGRHQKTEREARDKEQVVWEWSLVLWAMRIPHRIDHTRSGMALSILENDLSSAYEQINLYETENAGRATYRDQARSGSGSAESVFWVLLAVALWHGITQQQVQALGLDSLDWVEMGRVDGRAMLTHGQWWRALTALTLHSGPEHLLSNLVFGGVFMHLVCREIGGGVGWMLTVVAAGLANALNVLIQGPTHLAIGASTAVFAALGLLSGLSKPREKRWPVVLAPLGAGLALLAWLGSGGERTDVGAHLFGFAVGLALSLGLRKAVAVNKEVMRQMPQGMCGLFALGLMVSAWILAVLS